MVPGVWYGIVVWYGNWNDQVWCGIAWSGLEWHGVLVGRFLGRREINLAVPRKRRGLIGWQYRHRIDGR